MYELWGKLEIKVRDGVRERYVWERKWSVEISRFKMILGENVRGGV